MNGPAALDHPEGRQQALRIIFVSRALPVHRLGGLELHLRDLAVGLARRGHVVHIVTTAGGAKESLHEEVTVHEIPGTLPGDYSFAFFRNAGEVVQKLCDAVQADIVCPVDLAGLFFKPANISATVVPLIHGTLTSEVPLDWRYWRHLDMVGKLKAAWRYKARIMLMAAFKAMIRRMKHIIVDSEFTRRELMLEVDGGASAWEAGINASLLAKKILVVPLGLDMERYQEAKPVERGDRWVGAGRFRIAMLGRLQEIKGIGTAIHAAAALKARGVEFQLNIGGTGEYEAAAHKLIEALDLQQQVKLEGRIEPKVLSSWLAKHDLFLFADLTQPAFGLVVVEAMRSGLPVVTANVGAVSEVVIESCGWLYEPWDINGLAGLLMQLADNPYEISRKSACARARSDDFSAEKMALGTEQVFVDVASRK